MKNQLDEMARRLGPGHLDFDPIGHPRRYAARADREVVALLSALFAYGNVRSMGAFLDSLLGALGPSPFETLSTCAPPERLPLYRFQTSADVRAALRAVGAVLRKRGGLESAFSKTAGGAEEKLEAFASLLRKEARSSSAGVLHLLPLPSDGSACKRWWMFLRWVVRPDDGVDLGLWTCLSPRDLRIPVDTHVARIAFALGLVNRSTADRAFSIMLTESLRAFCPEDPTRYDFALAHLGILGECPRRQVASICKACSLRPHCRLGK